MRLPMRRTFTLLWVLLGVAAVGYAHVIDPAFRFLVSFLGTVWALALGWQLGRLLGDHQAGRAAGPVLALVVWLAAGRTYVRAEGRAARRALERAPELRAVLPANVQPSACRETHFDYFFGQYEFALDCRGRHVRVYMWPTSRTHWAIRLQ